MKINVTAKAGAKANKVEKVGDQHYRVWVKAPAREGEANQAVLEVLARYLAVAPSRLTLLSGRRSRNKIIGLNA